jgi:hypothetical protein
VNTSSHAEPDAQPLEPDAELAACFQLAHPEPSVDPFVGIVARRIAQARRRRRYLAGTAQAAGVAALVLCSHWLIQASDIASAKLDSWFAVGLDWLVTPFGTAAVVACCLGVAVALRRWVNRAAGQ